MKIIYKLLLVLLLQFQLTAAPVDEAIKQCFPSIDPELVTVKQLLGGYSADEKFTLEYDDKKYVLKVYAKSKNYDPLSEIFMMQHAGEIGVGPKIIYIDFNIPFVVMEFISGGTLSFDDAHLPENCVKIAKAIRTVHSIEKNPYADLQKFQLYTGAYRYLISQVGHKKNLDECFELMSSSNSALEKIEKPLVTIHGDLHPRNIFLTRDGVKFIDWNLSIWEDPFFDLAYFSVMSAYTPELDEMLLETYMGRVPQMDEWNRFHIQKCYAFSIMALTCFYKSFKDCQQTNTPYDFEDTYVDWKSCIRGFVDYESLSYSPQGLYIFATSALYEAWLLSEQYLR